MSEGPITPITVRVVVHLYDDLVSRSGHRSAEVGCYTTDEGTTGGWLLDYVRLELGLPALAPIAIIRNGRPVMPADLVAIDVESGDEFHAAPRPGTPIDLLLIAIAIASAAASAYLATKTKLPAIGATGDSEGPERRFGFNRFSNTAYVGDVIPVIYGHRRRYGGKVIAQVPSESSDGSGNAKLKILLCLSHGEIQSIGDQSADFTALRHDQVEGIYFNDQPLASFPGALVSGRLGTAGQAIIPGFKDVETLREVGVGGVELRNTDGVERTGGSASAEAFLYTTADDVNAVVARILLPAGLFSVGASGQVDPRRVKYRFRTRLSSGPGAWSAWTVITVERAEQSEFFSSPRADQLVGGAGDVIDIQIERVSIEPATGSLTEVDRLVWDSVVEVRYGSNTYPGLALLAVELTAGEQLNGVPRVSVDIKGKKVRVWDGVSPASAPVFNTAYSENPAWYALDWATNTAYGMGAVYGAGMPAGIDANDFSTLFAAAAYNDELVPRPQGAGFRPRLAAHFAVDEPRGLWDWLRAICASFRAVPTPSGSVLRYAQDRPQSSPVEVFTDASIALDEQGAQRVTYRRELTTRGLNRPNQLVCQFENENADGKAEVLAYPQLGEFWLGGASPEVANPESVRLEGVSDPDQVYAELIFRMNKIRALSRTIRLATTKLAVVAQALDRVDVAMNLVGWGLASGRCGPGSGVATVVIDRTVTLEGGKTYQVQVIHPDNSIEPRTITSPAGTYAPGAALSVSAVWAAVPEEFAEYSLAEVGKVLKPFTVTGVRIVDGARLEWELDLLEYNGGVYTLEPGPISLPGYSSLPNALTAPGPVLDLRAVERMTNGIHQVVLSWNQSLADAQITSSFRVYRRPQGLISWSLEPHPSISYRSAVIELSEFDRAYEFTVIAVSYGGAAMSPYDPRAPIVSIVMGLAATPPPPPTNLVLTNTGGNTYTLSWDEVEGAAGYHIMVRGGSPDGTGTIVGPGGGKIGNGTRDCMTLARVAGGATLELAGLELVPNYATYFFARSTIASGRMSFESSGLSETGVVPAGESVKQDALFDSGTGGATYSNLSWVSVGGETYLRLTDPDLAGGGTWTSAIQDSGALTLTELNILTTLKNDFVDYLLSANPFTMPSIAADQWGIIDDSPTRIVEMLQPPYPDDEQAVKTEVRTHDGAVWGAWEELAPCETVRRTFRQWQVRVNLSRRNHPYRLGVLTIRGVLTH